MKEITTIIVGFLLLAYIYYYDELIFIQQIKDNLLSFSSFDTILFFFLLFIFHLLFTFIYAKKIKLEKQFLLFLPSLIVAFLIFVLQILPILFYVFGKDFVLIYLNYNFDFDLTVTVICFSSLALLLGINLGKLHLLSLLNLDLINQKLVFKTLHQRKLDFLLSKKKLNQLLIFSIILALICVPFQLGLRLDLIYEGGRHAAREVNSSLVKKLIPLVNIIGYMLSIFAGIIYARTNKRIALCIPSIFVFPRLVILSRSLIIPIILFVLSTALIGKKISKFVLVSITFLTFFGASIALSLRPISSGGLSSLSNINRSILDIQNLIFLMSNFFEKSNIGIVGIAIKYKDPLKNSIDGFFEWLITISPIPSFFGIKSLVPTVAELLNITHYGITMPVFGELYFKMGWICLLVLFIFGFWLGRLEGKIIAHKKIIGNPYWVHVLLWLATLFGLIYSFHSPSRASTRVLLYCYYFIWFVEFLVSFNKKK